VAQGHHYGEHQGRVGQSPTPRAWEADHSGYPDCRDDTVKALLAALNLGLQRRFVLHTPLMWIDKAATFRLAQGLGGPALAHLILKETHTCYLGDRTHRHDWGYGCGTC
jgi:7-cyano-7-deazaguanine synthase